MVIGTLIGAHKSIVEEYREYTDKYFPKRKHIIEQGGEVSGVNYTLKTTRAAPSLKGVKVYICSENYPQELRELKFPRAEENLRKITVPFTDKELWTNHKKAREGRLQKINELKAKIKSGEHLTEFEGYMLKRWEEEKRREKWI